MIEGVDFSDSRPGGAALAAAGKAFVCRYVPYGGFTKGLTAAEVADYHAHGIAICLVFEQFANRALSGRAAGIADATTSKDAAAALGFPVTQPIYFAVDFDANAAQQPAIDAYLGGAAGVIGPGRVGVYGGLGVIRRCKANRSASWFWQTYAWSGGVVEAGIHLLQYSNDQRVGGQSVDLVRAYQANYGGWLGGTTGGTNQPGDEMASFTLLPGPAGTVTVKGAGHAYLRLADGSLHPVPDGFSKHPAYPVKLLTPIPGGSGDRATGYLIGDEAAFLLATDVTFVADPTSTDCTAAVKAATEPLTAKIAAARTALGA